jgi:hypothetical protein
MKKDFFSKLISNSVSEALSSLVEMSSEEFKRQKMEDDLKSRYKSASQKPDDDLTEKDEENDDDDQKKSDDDKIAKELGIDSKKIAPIAKNLPDNLKNKDQGQKDSGDSKQDSGQQKPTEPPKPDLPSKEEWENPTFESVINQINDIRSGSSMKDEIVAKNFKSYFEALSEPEQKMLLVFSTALNQIIKGKQAASEVYKPQKFGLSISMNQRKEQGSNDSGQDKNLEKNRNKSPELNKQPDSSDFSNPIIVGESKQVRNIIKKIR